VALAPRGYQRPLAGLRSIGVAFDGSAQSRVALVWAAGAAAQIGSPLRVIAVVVPDAPPDMREALSAAVADLPYDLPVELETPSGDPTLELRAAAGRGMDLLVAGSRGYGPFRGVLAGSVSAALARNCAAPVVVVPRAGRARADGTRSFATGEHELSPDEVAEMISASRMQVVDVRDAGELAAGALPGAHHIPVADLAADATTLSRELPVVFCSGTGERAALAMHACRALGMTAYSMRGGIDAWIKRGLPIESPAARPHTAPRAPGTAPAGRRPPRRSPAARA
jgi:nucleotide-binding universal stress UspA family protein/rhodanese-related sulfurtransferase